MTLQKKIKELILATNNQHKVIEIKNILEDLNFEIKALAFFPHIPHVVEDGATIEANAEKKAREIHKATGIISLADDTGLEVDYLNGEPGVFSSRFAGEDATYELNNQKLLSILKGVPWEQRRARFRCVMAICDDEKIYLLEGNCDGYILDEKRGVHGFGYDPVFYVPEYDKTFAEMPLSLKNQISHRGIALRKVRAFFENSA